MLSADPDDIFRQEGTWGYPLCWDGRNTQVQKSKDHSPRSHQGQGTVLSEQKEAEKAWFGAVSLKKEII